MDTRDRYESDFDSEWCPGCGNFGILEAMKDALASLNIAPHGVLMVSGIGQAAKTPHFLRCNTFHSLHGRALPAATGAKLANRDLTIIVNSGDGDCYGEGGNHFIHAIRRNVDLTLLVHNNGVYGLTKGQASPTSTVGMVTRIQHHGVTSDPFNPLAVALTLGCGFVARGFSGDREHLSHLIQAGIEHRGFSLIDIFQPCVSFNKINTFVWYKDRVERLDPLQERAPDDRQRALTLAEQTGDRLPIGIFYQEEKPTFMDRMPGLAAPPLVDRHYDAGRLQAVLDS
ncbi:MAG: 2-oxoacid:ferredoxin oxidoreductase subunit beta [Desulfobacterales bacterium]|nr:2-oxoacid:ferredoxin oxidoreductase subunit beta [Desulfobacterales bacterium]